MANHLSAKKRHRQNLKRRARNTALRSRTRRTLKKAREAISGKATTRAEDVKAAVRELYKAASKNVISKKNASRRVSRLMKAAAAAK